MLFERYSTYRKVKRDGNCFYRAFAFGLCEYLFNHRESVESKRIIKLLDESKSYLIGVGYELLGIEDFHESTVELLNHHDKIEDVEALFGSGYESEATVCYLRLLTAGVLKMNADFYSMFVEIDLETFIKTQVEPSINIDFDLTISVR